MIAKAAGRKAIKVAPKGEHIGFVALAFVEVFHFEAALWAVNVFLIVAGIVVVFADDIPNLIGRAEALA